MRQKKPLWLHLRNTVRCTTAGALVMTLHEVVCGRKWGTLCFLREKYTVMAEYAILGGI